MSFLNGTKSTHYAAAWTLVNAHELAVISGKVFFPRDCLHRTQLNTCVIIGMAAAYALGASYPEELMEE
jgi:hypothetical protein